MRLLARTRPKEVLYEKVFLAGETEGERMLVNLVGRAIDIEDPLCEKCCRALSEFLLSRARSMQRIREGN